MAAVGLLGVATATPAPKATCVPSGGSTTCPTKTFNVVANVPSPSQDILLNTKPHLVRRPRRRLQAQATLRPPHLLQSHCLNSWRRCPRSRSHPEHKAQLRHSRPVPKPLHHRPQDLNHRNQNHEL